MKTASNSKVLQTIPLLLTISLFCRFTHAETVQWPVSEGGNGHVYEVVSVPEGIIWVDANRLAEQKGGHLATITSQNENDFVFSLVNDRQYWNGSGGPLLGGHQLPGSVEPNGGWVWVTGEPFVYSNWRFDQPNNLGNENCIHFGWGGEITPTWNDLSDIYTANSMPIAYVVEYSHRNVYVDNDAAGAGDGTSWKDAYLCLQDALAAAQSGDEIRVAQGVYKPDERVVTTPRTGPQLMATGDRTETFQLINGVTIKGGYAGFGEPDPDVRNVDLYETILSGDLNGDDVDVSDPYDLVTEPTRTENSYHVVTGSGTDETAVLDGLAITAGNANGNQPHDKGGGMLNDSGSPTVANCTFAGNSARIIGGGMLNDVGSSTVVTNCTFTGNSARFDGGGIFNFSGGIPTVENCTFSGNSAKLGGGMYNDVESNTTVTKCTFSDNWAESKGGGMFNDVKSNTTVTNCIFIENVSDSGGAMYNDNNSPTLTNCMFSGNSADKGGGAMNNLESSPTLTNCTFIGNSAGWDGGGMENASSHPTLTNCIFSENSAGKWSTGISNTNSSNPALRNCILWGNTSQHIPLIHQDNTSLVTITYSDVQGGWPGQGNINTDPFFARPGYLQATNPRTGSPEVWIAGDYHLKSEAGRWDPNSQSWVVDDVTSPCIDAGDPNTSVVFEPFPNGGIINMGAYGGTVEASKSTSGLHAQYGRAFSPYPQDGAVNVPQILTLSWLPGGSGLYHDIYFSEDKEDVANATIESSNIYRGRLEPEVTTYNPGNLELVKTYYWRIDEFNQADPNGLPKGNVWSFTTANFIIVDDFEIYDAVDNQIWYSWHDGYGYGKLGVEPYYEGNGTGSLVGEIGWIETVFIHSGQQSMPYEYYNNRPDRLKYSEANLILIYPRDWTKEDVSELSLWFFGNPANDPELMYVVIANGIGTSAVIYHEDPNVVTINAWTEWVIPLQAFADQGINLTDVNSIAIGFGDRNNPQPGGSGKMWFDDIRLYRLREVGE